MAYTGQLPRALVQCQAHEYKHVIKSKWKQLTDADITAMYDKIKNEVLQQPHDGETVLLEYGFEPDNIIELLEEQK